VRGDVKKLNIKKDKRKLAKFRASNRCHGELSTHGGIPSTFEFNAGKLPPQPGSKKKAEKEHESKGLERKAV